VHARTFNVQHQDQVTWPADRVVAQAYVDQLVRSGIVPADRIEMLKGAVKSGDAATLSMISERLSERASSLEGADGARMLALSKLLTAVK